MKGRPTFMVNDTLLVETDFSYDEEATVGDKYIEGEKGETAVVVSVQYSAENARITKVETIEAPACRLSDRKRIVMDSYNGTVRGRVTVTYSGGVRATKPLGVGGENKHQVKGGSEFEIEQIECEP